MGCNTYICEICGQEGLGDYFYRVPGTFDRLCSDECLKAYREKGASKDD